MSKSKKKAEKAAAKKSIALSWTSFGIVLAVALVLEIFISNFSALGVILSGAEKKKFDMTDTFGSASVRISAEEPAEIRDVDTQMKNIALKFGGNRLSYANVTVAFTDDNFRFDDAFSYNKATEMLPCGQDSVSVMNISSYGPVGTIRITADENVTLTAVSLNTPPRFSFSMLRFIILSAVISCVVFRLWEKRFDPDNSAAVRVCALVMCFIVMFSATVIHTESGVPMLQDVSSLSGSSDIYDELFDAFLNHRLTLDTTADKEKLDALENPYDRSERNKNDLHGSFWDRAYYNSEFYCYFGAAPIFTVYYPVKLLTGKAPTPLLASTILCLHCVIFISLLYELFLKKFCRNVSKLFAVLGLPTVLFGSVIFAVANECVFYYIAVLSGVASTAAFLYFLFSAYFSEELKRRIVLLALAGISVVLIAASRPTLLLYCFIAVIPALEIFLDKKETMRNKAIYAASVGVPVVIGAALIMVYNNARFDSPFEFGFNYQLTVSIAKANTFKLSMIPPTLYHYFIQPPSYLSSFPYIRPRDYALDTYTRYNYCGRSMGIMMYPAAWGIALLPFTLTKTEKFKRRVLLSLIGSAILMAYIDMCKAGSHYRYTTDIAFVIMIVGIIAILDFGSSLRHIGSAKYKAFLAVAAVVFAATIILGGYFTFSNESFAMITKFPEATMFLRRL